MKLRLALVFFWFAIAFFNGIVMLYMAFCILFNTDRATKISVAYDRVGNAAMGNNSTETISSWAGRTNHWMEKPINYLFKILTGEDNHCDKWLDRSIS